MLNAALLATLIALVPAPGVDSARYGAEELARGFGATPERLAQAVGQLEELGLPVNLGLRLVDAEGRPAADRELTATWLEDRTGLRTDAEGRATLRLHADRLDTLQLELPPGVGAELQIDYLGDVGLTARCPTQPAVLKAAGC
jgi:hypothetical protein